MFKQHKTELVVIDIESPAGWAQIVGRGVRQADVIVIDSITALADHIRRENSPWAIEYNNLWWGNVPQVQEMSPAERAIREQVAANMGMAFVEPEPTPIGKYSMMDVDFTVLEERVLAHARQCGKSDTLAAMYGMHFAGTEKQADVYRYISARFNGTLGPNTITGRFSSNDPNPYISERARNLAPFAGGHLDRERKDLRERTTVKKRDPRCGFIGQCGV